MSSKLSKQPYKGARDFYPSDLCLRDYIFRKWRQVCQNYGYEEYDAPILEPLDIFSAKSGEELVHEQSYSFEDRGGRQVILRPEMTPSVSRMVANKRQELALPIRWFSIPNCWRYERPQKGRGREFYQLNVDLFGVDGSEAELEMLLMVNSIMQSFGASQKMYEIRVSSRKLINHIMTDILSLSPDEKILISRLIDRKHKMPQEEFAALLDASVSPTNRDKGVANQLLNILEATDLSTIESIGGSPQYKEVAQIIDRAKDLGVKNIVFDMTLIRGLDYYNGFVFEVFDTDKDNNRAMFGGGRYDGLIGLFGAEELPTIGFGMSDVMLNEFLLGHDLVPDLKPSIDVTVIPVGETKLESTKIADELRQMGVRTAVDYTDRKLDKQIKSAVKQGIKYVVFIGKKEIEEERFILKNLDNGEQSHYSLQRIVSLVLDKRLK